MLASGPNEALLHHACCICWMPGREHIVTPSLQQGLWKQGLEMADVEQKQLKDIWFFQPNAACATWESLPKEASQAEMHGLAWRGAQMGCPGYFIMTSSTSAPSPSPASWEGGSRASADSKATQEETGT